MKARPILMHARSIQNLLAGRKTQTRRIIKPRVLSMDPFEDGSAFLNLCPYGLRGGLLWVKETHAPRSDVDPALEPEKARHYCLYAANEFSDPRNEHNWHDYGGRWRPSIHMPRALSRLTLELTDVRVERVQDCSEEDALAEGVERNHAMKWPDGDPGTIQDTARRNFRALWDDTNGPGAWERNDWVWVLAFKIHKANVDELIREAEAEARPAPCDICGGAGCPTCNGVHVP